MTRLHQQTPDCADFDVFLGEQRNPSFSVLLPEYIRGEGIRHEGFLHIIPGNWREDDGGVHGNFMVAGQLAVGVQVEVCETEIQCVLALENIGDSEIRDVWADVCVSLNHLPGDPGWSNGLFLPDVPLDRDVQGRYWFEVLTPERLYAFTGDGWVPMHPSPARSDAALVPQYSFVPSSTPEANACAVECPDGGVWCFQQWDTPCRWCTPCPGNACMHLHPFLAEHLAPGAQASIRGRVGIHRGNRASLETFFHLFNP